MEFWILVGVLVAAMGLRLAFVAFHFRDMEQLWYDYEHCGLRFQTARLLDFATFASFVAAAGWALWKIDGQDPHRLSKFFVVWLGWSLLARLQVHHFPRTNRSGLYEQAKINLFVHLLMSLLGALVATAAAWIYFRWHG